MGLWERFAKRATDLMFEEVAENPQPTVSAEQLAGCEVEGDMTQTAQNMISEALKELDQAGLDNTINKVQECINTWGGDCDAATVLKLLQVAKQDPEVLRQDGRARIEKIEGVMQLVKTGMTQTLAEASQRDQEISTAESDEEAAYTAEVDALNKKCEENIKALREQLHADIVACGERRDQQLEVLKQQKLENNQIRAEAEALNREVTSIGNTLISQINNLLSKLNEQ